MYYTKEELENLGWKESSYLWYADRFFFCGNCKSYQYHDAMYFRSGHRIHEELVCKRCNISRMSKENE